MFLRMLRTKEIRIKMVVVGSVKSRFGAMLTSDREL